MIPMGTGAQKDGALGGWCLWGLVLMGAGTNRGLVPRAWFLLGLVPLGMVPTRLVPVGLVPKGLVPKGVGATINFKAELRR